MKKRKIVWQSLHKLQLKLCKIEPNVSVIFQLRSPDPWPGVVPLDPLFLFSLSGRFRTLQISSQVASFAQINQDSFVIAKIFLTRHFSKLAATDATCKSMQKTTTNIRPSH